MEVDVTVNRNWQSLSTLTNFPIGTPLELQYKGEKYQHIIFVEGSRPPRDSNSGNRLDYTNPLVHILSGSDEYWVRVESGYCPLHVGEL